MAAISATNVLLVRYAGGFLEVTNPASILALGRRIEGLLSLGNITDPTQATLLATQVLDNIAVEQLTITAGIEEPVSGPPTTPYEDFDLGDEVTLPTEDGSSTALERVVSLTMTADGEGNPIFAGEFGVPALLAEQRYSAWLQQMIGGTLAGTASSAAPITPPPPPQPGSSDEIITFHQPGRDSTGTPVPLRSGMSDEQPVNKTGVAYKVNVFLTGPTPGYGSGPNTVTIYKNGNPIGTVTVTAGNQNAVGYLGGGVPVECALGSAPDVLSVNFTTVDGVAFGGLVLISIK